MTYSSELSEIVLFDLLAKQYIRLTTDRFKDEHPSWSPDGQKVLFASKRPWKDMLAESGPSHLFILNISSGAIERLDNKLKRTHSDRIGDDNSSPSWAPTGSKIAFASLIDDSTQLLIVDLGTDSLIHVATNESIGRTAWSPDGSRLAWESYSFNQRGNSSKMEESFSVYELTTGRVVSTRRKQNPGYSFVTWIDSSTLLLSAFNPAAQLNEFVVLNCNTNELTPFKAALPSGYELVSLGNSPPEYILTNAITDSVYTSDLWRFNVLDGTLDRLTTDGFDKDNIQIYVGRDVAGAR